MPGPFQPFSTQHHITLAIGGITILALLILGKLGGKLRKTATGLLVFFNLAAYPLNLLAWNSAEYGADLDNALPLHLCDVAAFIAGFALLFRRPLLMALTYYWGLAATLQALLTPAITVGFPAWPFITFFLQHFAIVAAAVYMPIVEGWQPEKPFFKSPFTAYLCALAYLLTAMAANALMKTNFGFTMHPPENPSLIDHLGPWPWYLLSFNILCFAIFCVLTIPFLFLRSGGPEKALIAR